MRYISTFSGIEAASVAWEPLGWEAIAFSEIDKFPSAVLDYRLPFTPNLGDITKVDWTPYQGKIDLVVGGSPCQSFSIAGNREGLKGESGLMFEFIRCVREVRPRWFLWENVPGALSSERGAAFGQLLHEMAVIGGYGCAWRILDALFFGVPQRRRRLFLVGCARDRYRQSHSVLFDTEDVRGNTTASKEKWQEITSSAHRRFAGAGECISLQDDGTTSMNTHGSGWKGDGSSYTLNTVDQQSVMIAANQRGELRFDGGDGLSVGALPACQTSTQLQGVLCMADSTSHAAVDNEVCGTLHVGGVPPIVGSGYIVRHLTPIEYERLQGFPDDWTKIPWRGKPADECPDTPRYKALGNSMAVPVMRWLGERIGMVDKTL